MCGEVQDCADSGDLVQRLREAFYYQVLASGHHHPDDYLCQIIGHGAFHYQVHVGCHEDHLVSKTKKYQTMTKCNFQVCRKSDEILCTICGKELSCKCLLNVSSDRSCDEEHNYIIAMIVLMIMMIIVSFFYIL